MGTVVMLGTGLHDAAGTLWTVVQGEDGSYVIATADGQRQTVTYGELAGRFTPVAPVRSESEVLRERDEAATAALAESRQRAGEVERKRLRLSEASRPAVWSRVG